MGIGPVTRGPVDSNAYDAVALAGMAAGNSAAANDTAIAHAITAAVAGGYRSIYLRGAATAYQFSQAISPPESLSVWGDYRFGAEQLHNLAGTTLQQTDSSKPVFQIVNSRNGFPYVGAKYMGLHFKGGQDGIRADNGLGQGALEDVYCDSFSRYGLMLQGQVQDIALHRVKLSGGVSGLYHPGTAGVTYAGTAFFDKSVLDDLWIDNTSGDAISLAIPSGNHIDFRMCRLTHIAGNGMNFAGGWRNLMLRLITTEYVGYVGSGARYGRTTCSTTSGSAVLTNIPDTTGLQAGDVLTIRAAGTGGADLQTTIQTLDSTTVTGDANAATTITSAELAHGTKSEIVFSDLSGSKPAQVTIENFTGSGESTTVGQKSEARYSIDLSNATGRVLLQNCNTSTLEVYDPGGYSIDDNQASSNTKWRVPKSGWTAASGRRNAWESNTTGVTSGLGLYATATGRAGDRVLQNQSPLTSGTLHLSKGFKVRQGIPIFSLAAYSGATAAGTPTHQWFCLVDQSFNVLCTSVDDTTTAWSANSRKALAISGGVYIPGADTDVYFGVMVAAATPPSLHGFSHSGASIPDAESPKLNGNSTAALTTPASLGSTATSIGSVSGINVYGCAG